MYFCCGITTKGIMPHNEDAFLINKIVGTDGIVEANMTAPFIAAVSDGVSSELSGEVASRLCMKFLRNIKISPKTNLQNRILKIHERLKRYGVNKSDFANMQATLCALVVDEKIKYTINFGDQGYTYIKIHRYISFQRTSHWFKCYMMKVLLPRKEEHIPIKI